MSLADWGELIKATGFDMTRMSVAQIGELSGRILHDEVVCGRKLELARRTGNLPLGTTAKIVRAMSEQERLALRERVSGVLKFPVK